MVARNKTVSIILIKCGSIFTEEIMKAPDKFAWIVVIL